MSSGLLDTALQSVKSLRNDLEQEAYKILAEVQKEILDLNREQLLQGLDNQGQKLTPKYSRVRYARAKNSVNPLAGLGTPDLKLTGRFHSNFYLIAQNKQFTIFSSDEKSDKLTSKYGDNIFGLTEKNEEVVNFEIIYPKLLEWILNQLTI